MAITVTPGGTIYTGDDTHVYRIHVLRAAMELELKGIRVRRRSVIASVKREFGLRGNRLSVYTQFCRMHQIQTQEERCAQASSDDPTT